RGPAKDQAPARQRTGRKAPRGDPPALQGSDHQEARRRHARRRPHESLPEVPQRRRKALTFPGGSCLRTAQTFCRLTVSAARTNVALLIRRAVRCSRSPSRCAPPGGKGRVLARPGWAGAKEGPFVATRPEKV